MKNWTLAISLIALTGCQSTDPDLRKLAMPNFSSALPPPTGNTSIKNENIRFATYNTSLYSDDAGGLILRLRNDDANAKKIAAVIQHQRPDILLLNEFDYDKAGIAAELFQKNFLAVSQDGQMPIIYPYYFIAPVNTGIQSGMDLDNDGTIGGTGRTLANDAFGYGMHPGQYGMLVLSQYPIDLAKVRTFQKLLWKDLPDARIPINPGTLKPWYKPEVWPLLRLSSKSHWDLPIETPLGTIHFLVAHPTPPIFDGPEDRNGARNYDEIKLWSEYVNNRNAQWLCDDNGFCGGLAIDTRFVIAGDYNADPIDGICVPGAIQQLLENPRVLSYQYPESEGANYSALQVGNGNLSHKGKHANDTGDFGPQVGNLRLDYVLPSSNFHVSGSGVFWLKPTDAGYRWMDASDHHMVWLDITN